MVQLNLFDPDSYLMAHPGISEAALSPRSGRSCRSSRGEDPQGRPGFWYENSPTIFGHRCGGGPLLAGLDTSILISLSEALEEPDGELGFLVHPLWSNRESLGTALRDLVQLWWWRDVRFWISDSQLDDAPDQLSKERVDARERALDEIQRDLWERGGFPADTKGLGPQLPDFEDVNPGSHARDFELANAALRAGCQVLLTADKGMRRWNRFVSPHGLLILTVGELLDALDEAGELDDCSAMASGAPAPDISPMIRLYVGFS